MVNLIRLVLESEVVSQKGFPDQGVDNHDS